MLTGSETPVTPLSSSAPATIRLLLVDDDPLVMSSLRLYFSTPAAAAIEVVGEATDGAAALDLLKTVEADVMMTDIHMPGMDGVSLLREVRSLDNPPVFIAMTALDDEESMLSILSLGGAGYILKSSRPEYIIDTVHQTIAGGTVVSPQPATRLVQHLPTLDGQEPEAVASRAVALAPECPETSSRLATLSSAEERVLTLICTGLSNSEIARNTGRSASAVKKAVSSLLAKFGTESRIQLAVLAVEAGFHPED